MRYRKDNGRIASDVISYETSSLSNLDESLQETQNLLFKFLKDKDEKNTEILKSAIIKDGQSEPAIITCDGYLINGNRRKMVLQLLNQDNPTEYNTMKVIILPNIGEEGGQPTLKEIELLENRYQLTRDGKSEYEGLDRALSIRRKMEIGISIETQLKDDPLYAGKDYDVSTKKFKSVVEDFKRQFLYPLEKVDEYLEMLNRPGHYSSISGKWQSFIEYSNFYHRSLTDDVFLAKNDISDSDVGKIQDACFNIIRKFDIKGIKRTRNFDIIRDVKKLSLNENSRKQLTRISTDVRELTESEMIGKTFRDIDDLWANAKINNRKNSEVISQALTLAYDYHEDKKSADTPLTLIKEALKRVTSESMIIDNISDSKDMKEFRKIAEELEKISHDLKNDVLLLINKGSHQ